VGFAAARCQALPWPKRREISGAWQRGAAAIDAWSQREIFDPQVTLEALDMTEGPDETVVSTKVDGNFDRTGLPDRVIIDHHIAVAGRKIVRLTCRLATEAPRS